MATDRIELRYRDHRGTRALKLPLDANPIEEDGVALSARIESRHGRSMVHALVANHGSLPIHLDSVRFHIATGFPADRPAHLERPYAVGRSAKPSRTDRKASSVRLVTFSLRKI